MSHHRSKIPFVSAFGLTESKRIIIESSVVSRLLIFLFLGIGIVQANSQSSSNDEFGNLSFENYLPEEYNGHNQNWSIVQDSSGMMYFGNGNGVHRYDGVNWLGIPLSNGATCRSLAIDDDDGTVYVGGQNQLGYLYEDSLGNPQFRSLVIEIDEQYRTFGDVWNVLTTPKGVYFVSAKYIFLWSAGKMNTIKSRTLITQSLKVNEEVYVFERASGISTVAGDSLILIPEGDEFATNNVVLILPFEAQGESMGFLLFTAGEGTFVFDGSEWKPFETEASDVFDQHAARRGKRLSDGTYALGVVGDGLVIIDSDGRLLHHMNDENGLPSNIIGAVYPDEYGGLWVGTFNGISRIEYPSSSTHFNEKTGLEGTVLSIIRHKGILYVATESGVFYLDSRETLTFFKRLPEIPNGETFEVVDKKLLAAARGHLYMIEGTEVRLIDYLESLIYDLKYSSKNSGILYVATTNGLKVLRKGAVTWADKGYVAGIDSEIRDIVEDQNGNLWLGTRADGVFIVQIDASDILNPLRTEHFKEEHGLPSLSENDFYSINGEPVLNTSTNFHRFNKIENRFEVDSLLGQFFIDEPRTVYSLAEDEEGRLWASSSEPGALYSLNILTAVPQDGRYVWRRNPYLSLPKSMNVLKIYPEENGIIWFGGTKGLVRFDENALKSIEKRASTIVTQVSIADSVIFSGNKERQNSRLPYGKESIQFAFSLTSYEDEPANQFQYFLEGFDQGWSTWTLETKKNYTNLPEGSYRFRVQGKSAFDIAGSESSYSFVVLPPWYRTWWAYAIYAILLIGLIQLIIYWRSGQLKRDKLRLEQVVAERTEEIAWQNNQLEEQAVKLKQVDKIKSNFFANISHEFRTPLTLIQGPLNAARSKGNGTLSERHLDMMQANTKRLLRLVNQLLDLSKLETSSLKLAVSEKDIIGFVRGLSLSFESLALEKSIDLTVLTNEQKIPIYFDSDKLEKVFYNLLSNAFKFTDALGKIEVEVQNKEEGVLVKVRDTGIGIEANHLSHVFDRFYQVDGTHTRIQEGSGIGLALTRELVELHHGSIEVQSTPGEGTEFLVTLKKGSEHFASEDLVKDVSSTSELLNEAAVSEERFGEDYSEEQISESMDLDMVLIVEDNEDVREFVKEQLTNHYQIREAKNGKEGLSLAQEIVPDLIVSDVMMPQMDGFELTAKLREDVKTSHIPIILLTAKAGGEEKIEGLETGADDYLTKPFDGKELVARISNLIQLRRALREKFSRELMLEPTAISVSSIEEKFISQVIGKIEENMSNSDLSVEKLSADLGISRIHLHRKLKALTGQSASSFIRLIRLKRAKQLLDQQGATISEVAYQVGFNSTSYFAKCFREQFGTTPTKNEAST
ncbi:MAG: response regulator [Cyclobacteriaceae bacterium]